MPNKKVTNRTQPVHGSTRFIPNAANVQPLMERSGKPGLRAAVCLITTRLRVPGAPWKTTAHLQAQPPPKQQAGHAEACPSLPGGPREPAPRVYLVECGHGCRAHHQGYADDRVAVEAIRVGHHHDPSDGEDGGHDLDGRKTRWSGQRWGIGGAP